MVQLGRILGDYQILNELGRGGMGAVYKANDYRRNRIVAMKVLPAELAYTRTFMQRFEREIETLQRLNHPNIVQMYDVGEAEDIRFYCMEYVDGGSVEHRLETGDRLPLVEALDITYQVAEALEYAHSQGVIHRDIKPGNILITRDGTAKLTDFGVAKVIEATMVTVTSGIVGTIEYLAPEQASGGAVTPATDIYSLGVTLYEMVTGRPPFEGETPSQILHRQLHSLPEQPRNLRPEVPQRLNDLIVKMLEKQSERRISSAQALKRELERIKVQLALAGRQVSAEVLQRERGWRDYVPLAVGVALLGLVAVLFYHAFRPATAEELFAQAQRAFAEQRCETCLDHLEELRDRFPLSPLLGEADVLEGKAREQLPAVLASRRQKRRERTARGELRLAQGSYEAGNLELALERCHIILKYYDEFQPYAQQARALAEKIEGELGGTGGSADVTEGPRTEDPQARPVRH